MRMLVVHMLLQVGDSRAFKIESIRYATSRIAFDCESDGRSTKQ